jgi:hypothetical protein
MVVTSRGKALLIPMPSVISAADDSRTETFDITRIPSNTYPNKDIQKKLPLFSLALHFFVDTHN